jgi:hypothetical protein
VDSDHESGVQASRSSQSYCLCPPGDAIRRAEVDLDSGALDDCRRYLAGKTERSDLVVASVDDQTGHIESPPASRENQRPRRNSSIEHPAVRANYPGHTIRLDERVRIRGIPSQHPG